MARILVTSLPFARGGARHAMGLGGRHPARHDEPGPAAARLPDPARDEPAGAGPGRRPARGRPGVGPTPRRARHRSGTRRGRPRAGTEPGELPAWWPELAQARAAGRPVVHVTQGTFDLTPDDLLKPTIAGLAGYSGPAGAAPLVVCATGGAPVEVLGPLPDNVRAAPLVPHDLLLPQVDVMVTNGGWGGVLAAVAAGVPLVVAGDSLDKPEVARRVAWSGVGLDLRTGRPSPRRVRDAVAEVLTAPSMRQRARELATAMAAAGGTHTAGPLLEALLTRTPDPGAAHD